jgi:hypothetical protein
MVGIKRRHESVNIAKIQSDLLTFIVRQKYDVKERNSTRFGYGVVDMYERRYIMVVVDGVLVYLIKADDFVIDLLKWGNARPLNFKNVIKEAGNAKNAVMTDERRDIPGKKETIVKIANDSEWAWVDEKRLKMFDRDAWFKITNRKSPVFVYEHEELAGIVLPVVVMGGEQ